MRESAGDPLPSGALSDPSLADSLVVGPKGYRLNSDLSRVQGFVSLRSEGEGGGWGALSLVGHSTERGIPPEAHTITPRLWRFPDQREMLLSLSAGTEKEESFLGPLSLKGNLGVRLGSLELEDFSDTDFREAQTTQWEDDRMISLRVSGDRSAFGGSLLRGAITASDVHHAEGHPGEVGSDYRQRLWSLGSELEAPFTLLADELQGRLAVGVVLDGADTPRAGPWEPVPGLHEWGARAGASALLGPSGERRIHLSLSRRARIPSLREMYSGALGRFLPNPGLRPETQIAVEGGATLRRAGSEVQLVLFHQRMEDGIVRVSVAQADGLRLLQRVNRDRVHASGVELLTRLEGAVGEVEADLTVQRVRVFGADPTLPERPEYEPGWQGSVSASSSIARFIAAAVGEESPRPSPSSPWNVALRSSLEVVGPQHCLDPAAGDLARLDASHTVNARAELPLVLPSRGAVAPRRQMALGVGMSNLTNALSFDQCGLPRPGRSFHLSFRIR